MKIDDLPFLHFMVKIETGGESGFVSPMEIEEEIIPGGFFCAPVREDANLFPAYRFHFSIYLGNGEFLKRDDRKWLFNGVAVAFRLERRDHLLLTFNGSNGDTGVPYSCGELPAVIRDNEELLLPMLRRVPRQAPRPYSGHLWHRDFEFKLAEFEYADEREFEVMFDKYRISIVGCDPHSKYEARRG